MPFATGMSISITLLTLKSYSDIKCKELNQPLQQYVIFPRIDQKTCLKSIYTANLTPLIIEPLIKGDELATNITEIKNIINDKRYKDKILAVLSTTSCFAPRVYDSIIAISTICKEHEINHVVNSAYGLQCSRISSDIVWASKVGRLDVIVSSTDKNFMVPVGGSIVYSPQKSKSSEGIGII